MLLEHEILRDHGTHAAGPTEPCGRDGQVKQGEEDSFHTRHSRSRDRRNATLPSPRFQRENWEFETHTLDRSFRSCGVCRGWSRAVPRPKGMPEL